MKTAVEITNLGDFEDVPDNPGRRMAKETEVYIARSEKDCRDDIDRMVYNLVLEHGTCITIGRTIGRLAFGSGWTKPLAR